jgi:hypothetical protein
MPNYSTAENVAKVTMALGWLTIAVGITCVFLITPGGFYVGAALAVGGILVIASSQMTLAVIDTAKNSARMVEILERAFPHGTPNRWARNENVALPENHTKHQLGEGSHRWTEAP